MGLGKVLVLVDWDNLFYSLFNTFGQEEMRLEERLQQMMHWIKKEIGEIWGDSGFVFAPEHLPIFYQELCTQSKLKIMVCPKRKLEEPQMDPKKGHLVSELDTVDETIIWFGERLMGIPEIGFVCLVSGDADYIPLFQKASQHGILRVLVAPSHQSLSRSDEFLGLVDDHPLTHKKMLLHLDQVLD